MKWSIKALSAGALMSLSALVMAVPITGNIGFGSGFTTDTGSLATAGTIFVTGNNAVILGANGDLTGVVGPVTYNDFALNGSGLPQAPLWTDGNFYFNLLTMSLNSQNSSEIALTGTGIMGGTGFDETEYRWSWSGDSSDTGLFSAFSSTNTPVPEPGTLALLGLGLAGLGAARRRQRA